MYRTRLTFITVLAVGVSLLFACLHTNAQDRPQQPPAKVAVMDNARLEEFLEKHFAGKEIEGQPGLWRIVLEAEEDGKEDAEPEGDDQEPQSKEDAGEEDAEFEEGPGAGERLPAAVLVMTDERADRMRVMMAIRPFNPNREEDQKLAMIALQANFDRALDARYAVQGGVLWSVFIHPLGSLTPADLANGIKQVQTLRKNTGTTYSSSDLLFGGNRPQQRDDVI